MPGIRCSTVAWIQSLQCLIDHNLSNFCLNCESVVQTTWTKIVLTIASPGLKISPNCFCGQGSALDPTWGAYSAPPDPLAGFRGGGRKGERKGREGRGRGRGGEGVWFNDFQNGGRPPSWILKFEFLVTWLLSACSSASWYKMSLKSDNRSMSYGYNSDFQYGGGCHLEF